MRKAKLTADAMEVDTVADAHASVNCEYVQAYTLHPQRAAERRGTACSPRQKLSGSRTDCACRCVTRLAAVSTLFAAQLPPVFGCLVVFRLGLMLAREPALRHYETA